MNRRREWLVPLTGVGFILVGAVSFVVAGEPKSADEPVGEIVEFYVDNKDSVQAATYIRIASLLLLVFFGAYLQRVLRTGAEGEILSLVSFLGIVVAAVGLAIDATIMFALSEAASDVDPVAVQSLQALWDYDFVPVALGVHMFLWATGLAVIRTGVLPRWLGWVMISLAVIGLTPVGLAGGGAAILVVVLSVLLSVRARAGAAPA